MEVSHGKVRKVALVSTEAPPLADSPATGGALRLRGLYESLRQCGVDVSYVVPEALIPRPVAGVIGFKEQELNELLLRLNPDAVLCEQWGIASLLRLEACPLIIDFHGSIVLENSFRLGAIRARDIAAKLQTLARSSLFLVPGSRQKYYFLAWLLAAGLPPQEHRIVEIPLAFPPQLPAHTFPAEPVFVYGGHSWPWIDSSRQLQTLANYLIDQDYGLLDLYLGRMPRQAFTAEILVEPEAPQSEQVLPDSPRIRRTGLITHQDLIASYCKASVAFDVYSPNWERALAVTTRTLEYLWCGLPVVYSGYGELAQVILDYEAGWIVDPDDPTSIRQVLDQIFADTTDLQRRGANAHQLVRERYTWEAAAPALKQALECLPVEPLSSSFPRELAEYLHQFEIDEDNRKLHLLTQTQNQDLENLNHWIRNLQAELATLRTERAMLIEEHHKLTERIIELTGSETGLLAYIASLTRQRNREEQTVDSLMGRLRELTLLLTLLLGDNLSAASTPTQTASRLRQVISSLILGLKGIFHSPLTPARLKDLLGETLPMLTRIEAQRGGEPRTDE